ncbi:hypothetical protein GLW04_16590 [Halobacillus litoralis]|uniref:LamG-like jellyroll fold domain-containing protein n=1 Tax=Halobacillus litoralis TaxID=45668 RepID=A0A845E761_9BACI|nr:GH32 C-terminal domain-containing protein [Halobacillus litoralis]MYL21524.1 hypothetical protein [Halobacillus litoralis]
MTWRFPKIVFVLFFFFVMGVLLPAVVTAETSAYRSAFHYSPDENWMNDPNGLVYYDGEYHLFYQHNPAGNVWGPMYWGHAVSEDLINWKELSPALFPDEKGFIWSGSVVVDEQNTSGFKNGSTAPMVALFTQEKNGGQIQSLAYSHDKGRSWTMYEGNPVIDRPEGKDVYRDPKVFWHEATEQWVMLLSGGQSIEFYQSKDLKTWDHVDTFERPSGGEGVWECPDLVRLPVEGKENEYKWALIVSISEGAEAGGSGMEYYIGEFNGSQFQSEQGPVPFDFGSDMYAGVTWNNLPEEENRTVLIGWMNNWQYGQEIPSDDSRGTMSLPRELTLLDEGGGKYSIQQQPADEFGQLKEEGKEWEQQTLSGEKSFGEVEDLIQIEASFDMEKTTASELGLKLTNESGEETVISIFPEEEKMALDRTASGESDFSEHFAAVHNGPMKSGDGTVDLSIIIDRTSIEMFADNGRSVWTDQIFRDTSQSELHAYSRDGEAAVTMLRVTPLKSAPSEKALDEVPASSPETLENGGFETGDLTGWTTAGSAFSSGVSEVETYWEGDSFDHEGKYHLWGFSEDVPDSDFRTGTLQSAPFTLSGQGKVDFLVGGGEDLDRLYVSLVRAEDGKELFKATGADDEKYRRVSWDAADYIGETLYIKVVDFHTEGFGHLNVDDFQVYHEGSSETNTLINGDFETGDLTGWTSVEGEAFTDQSITDQTDWGWGGPFNHNGGYHLWGALGKGDDQTGVLHSNVFTLSGTGEISFLIGGGNNPDELYVALVRASDDKELIKASNEKWEDSEAYHEVMWDASDYRGEEVYLKIVDRATGGWGHINVDHFQVNQTGTLAHYPFDEEQGAVTKEAVSSEVDPVHYVFNEAEYKADSDPLWRKGLKDNALLFDGYSTWVTQKAEDVIQPEDALTVEGWVAPRSYEWGDLNQVSAIVNQHDPGKKEGYVLGMGRHGVLAFKAGIGGEWVEVDSGDHVIEKDQWSHVAGVFDHREQKLRVYINGELVGESSTPSGSLASSEEDLLIGKHNKAALLNGVFEANMFHGLMDDVKISNEAKTTEQLKKSFDDTVGGMEGGELPKPELYWDRNRYAGDQHRPQYHFMPPEHWMNEPHAPLYFGGKYHIFYQKNPQGPYWHQIHWGHAVSEDLVHWEEMPEALAPEKGSVAPDGVWSGSAVVDNGEPYLFFTAGDDSRFPNQMTGLAVSENPEDPLLKDWRMLDEPVTVQEENLPAEDGEVMYGQFRDPFVFKDGDTWYQLMGSGIDQVGGTALLYSSKDLKNWTYEKPFFTGDSETYPKTGDVWELPVFLPIGKDDTGKEKYAFFINPWFDGYSPHNVKYTFYWVGTWDAAKLEFVPDHEEPRQFDYGEHFTGPSGMIDEDGTPLLFSIAQDKRSEQEHYDAGWAHNAGLPVELSLSRRGDLGLKPIEELETLRGSQLVSMKNQSMEQANEQIEDVEGDLLEVVLEIDMKEADKAGLKVRQSKESGEETLLLYDQSEEHFAIDRNDSSLNPDVSKGIQGGELLLEDGNWNLHVYLDRSMVEAYANEQKSITSRVYPTSYDALGIELWSEGGEVEVVSMDVWELNGAFGEVEPVYEKEQPTVPPHGELPNHDFQNGDLSGWNVVEGDAFSDAHITAKQDWGWGGPFDQAEDSTDLERFHLWGFLDAAGGDAATGVMESEVFELSGSGQIDFLIGGGKNVEELSVALVRASDDQVLKEATGRNKETYRRVEWDASDFIGEQLLIRVTDRATGGWGHINVDDVNVPTALSEEAQLFQQLKDMPLTTSKDLDKKIDLYEKVKKQQAAGKGELDLIRADMLGFLLDQLRLKKKAYTLTDQQLPFLVQYAIEETGAEDESDYGEVQGFVMKRVNKHATGKQVRDVIEHHLS